MSAGVPNGSRSKEKGMRLRTVRSLVLALLAVTATLAVAPVAAQAESSTQSTTVSRQLTAQRVVSVAENGDKHVLTLGGGQQVTMTADQYARWAQTPVGQEVTKSVTTGGAVTNANPYVVGNCGASWIYLDGIGGLRIQVNTGYQVTAAVLWSDWWVDIFDQRGASEQYYGAGANGGTWGTTNSYGGMAAGYSWAEVSTSSYAVLWYGAICTSGGPWDDAVIR
jgi:hypothetical protein